MVAVAVAVAAGAERGFAGAMDVAPRFEGGPAGRLRLASQGDSGLARFGAAGKSQPIDSPRPFR